MLAAATLTEKLNLPLVSLAGFVGARVTEAAQAVDKLMVLESHTASHTGAGIGPPIRGTYWYEAVRTTTGKTCRRAGEAGRERTYSLREDSIHGFNSYGMITVDTMTWVTVKHRFTV